MITLGSISREEASARFSFLSPRARGRRTSLRAFTHRDPELVFWIDPSGRLVDAKRSHRENPPRGFEHIVDDEPDYGGFLRGRVARSDEHQLVVVYCRSEALEGGGPAVRQLLAGIDAAPIPVEEDALVISDNAGAPSQAVEAEERGESRTLRSGRDRRSRQARLWRCQRRRAPEMGR